MSLQSYQESDLEAVAHLFTASVHTLAASHYDPAQRAAWAPQPPDLDEWRQRLSAVETLVPRGITAMYTKASLVARPFFARHGFRVVEEQVVVRRGVAFRRFAMQKPISYAL